MTRLSNIFSLFIIIVLFWSCDESYESKKKSYLFLGHTYQWGVKDNNRIDYRLKDFDFKKYDQLWLGGDLCARSNEDPFTLQYLDSIFDLSAATSHWALGNHDVNYGSVDLIKAVTKRNTYYTTSFDGINLVVLNTNEFHHPNYSPKPQECNLLDGQIQMLENLADTIQSASHVVILHHYALLTNSMTDDSLNINTIFNFYKEDLRVDCAGRHTFESRIYPILKRIKNKGFPVILVSGDLGQRSKAFKYRTKDGIWFLGSGINNSALDIYIPDYVTDTSSDKVLIFEHDVVKRVLDWRFVAMEEM